MKIITLLHIIAETIIISNIHKNPQIIFELTLYGIFSTHVAGLTRKNKMQVRKNNNDREYKPWRLWVKVNGGLCLY